MTSANLCWPSIPNRLMHHVFGNISRAFRDISNSALGSVVIPTTLRASEMEHTVRQKVTPRVSQIMTAKYLSPRCVIVAIHIAPRRWQAHDPLCVFEQLPVSMTDSCVC